MKKTQKGFTLIELLVVIAIIGILSSVVLASLNTARTKARDARRAADIGQLKLAAELYADDNSAAYPATLSALAPDYIGTIPVDPTSGSYVYEVDTPATAGYCLGAVMENITDSVASSSDAACETSLGGGVNYAVAP